MEQCASDEGRIADDTLELSCGQIEEQRNRGERESIGSGHDQDESQLLKRKMTSATWNRALHLAVDPRTRRQTTVAA